MSPTRLRPAAILVPAGLAAALLTGCGGSTTTGTAATTAVPSGSGAAPSSSAAGGPTTTTASRADEYPGGVATVEVDIASDVLTWSGTLTGECEPNPIAAFTTKITAKDDAGIEFWMSPSLPSAGTFDSADESAIPKISELVVNFPSSVLGDTRPTTRGAPPRVESFTDPTYSVTFDDDTGTKGTVAITRFRFPGTQFHDGTASVTWSCA